MSTSSQEELNMSFDTYYKDNNITVFEPRDYTDNYSAGSSLSLDVGTDFSVPENMGEKSTKDYSKSFDEATYSALNSFAEREGKDFNQIAGMIWNESGSKGTQAVNPTSRARGLWQAMPSTLKSLGVTEDEMMIMNADQQMNLASKYFAQFGDKWKKAKTTSDMYALLFYPMMAGKEPDYVLGSHKSDTWVNKIATQNKIFDLNNDGKITKQEFYDYSNSKLKSGGILHYKHKK